MNEEQTPPEGDKSYPPMIATGAILQYLREIFMNNIIETKKEDVDTFEVKNPNNEGNSDPIIQGVNADDEE